MDTHPCCLRCSAPAHGFALSDRERISNRISFDMDECFIVQDDGTVFMDRVTAAKYPEVKLWKEIIAVSANTDAVIGLRKDGTVIGTGSLVSGMEKQAIAQWRNVSQVLRTLGTTYGITSSGILLYVSEYGGNAADSDRGKACADTNGKTCKALRENTICLPLQRMGMFCQMHLPKRSSCLRT